MRKRINFFVLVQGFAERCRLKPSKYSKTRDKQQM
jgi:hypothetical protein